MKVSKQWGEAWRVFYFLVTLMGVGIVTISRLGWMEGVMLMGVFIYLCCARASK